MAFFDDVQYCIYADIVGGWVKKSPKICWRNIGMAPEEDQYPDLTQPLTFDKQAKLKLGEPHSQPASPLPLNRWDGGYKDVKFAAYIISTIHIISYNLWFIICTKFSL